MKPWLCLSWSTPFLFCIGLKSAFLITGSPTAAAISEEPNPTEATQSGPHTIPHANTLRPALTYIDNQSYVDSNLDTHSQEPTHLNWQDYEFPSRARTFRAGGGAEEEGQTCSGPISSLLQFFIRNLSPVPWSSAAFPLHAASILYASTAHSCHSSPDKNKKGSYRHPFPKLYPLIIPIPCASHKTLLYATLGVKYTG